VSAEGQRENRLRVAARVVGAKTSRSSLFALWLRLGLQAKMEWFPDMAEPLWMHIEPDCPLDGIEDALGTSPERNVELVAPLFGRSDVPQARAWVLRSVVRWCHSENPEKQAYQLEIRAQGLLRRLVQALPTTPRGAGSMYDPLSRALTGNVIAALMAAVVDDRQSVITAAEDGLLHALALGLKADPADNDHLCLNHIVLCNQVLSTTSLITTFLEESGIVPVIVQFADEKSPVADGRVRLNALACLANLSNYEGAVDVLVQSKALEVLAQGLRVCPVEKARGEHPVPRYPSVHYMQSLAAVVKIVGRGTYMGAAGTAREGPDAFCVCGADTTSHFDPSAMKRLILDRRSVVWMLSYLRAAIEDVPYPPTSNVFGKPWKVSLSLACMATGSADNRLLLHESGVWLQLLRAVVLECTEDTQLVIPDAQEEGADDAAAIAPAMLLLLAAAAAACCCCGGGW